MLASRRDRSQDARDDKFAGVGNGALGRVVFERKGFEAESGERLRGVASGRERINIIFGAGRDAHDTVGVALEGGARFRRHRGRGQR